MGPPLSLNFPDMKNNPQSGNSTPMIESTSTLLTCTPTLIEIETRPKQTGIFQNITHDQYTLTPIESGTRVAIESLVYFDNPYTTIFQNFILRILLSIVSRPIYYMFRLFKKIFSLMFYRTVQQAMEVPFNKLKTLVENKQ